METVQTIMLGTTTYVIVDEINNYVYLTEEDNIENFCVRKKIIENGEPYLIGLSDEQEFINALHLFEQNHKIS